VLSKKVKTVQISSITFDRTARQRSEIDVSDILESVRRRGILTPICITESGRLIFGERRLTAAKQCGHTEILARIAPDSLSEIDLETLELEENIMREDLSWQDRARAVYRLWQLYEQPTQTAFAKMTGYDSSTISRYLDAAQEMLKGNERVSNAPTLNKAVNVTVRQRERETNHALADIIDTVGGSQPPPLEVEVPSLLNLDFHSWAQTYSGLKFNVIHCDFPYGINLHESDQLQVDAPGTHQTYNDTEDTFWQLCETLASCRNNFLSHSAHMIFWYSMKFQVQVMDFMRNRLPEWTFDDYPLVWMKSDNRGIAPDVERRPRRIYETALFGWRGERKLVA
jgi:ParB/RepB/Spo0J family partition protein